MALKELLELTTQIIQEIEYETTVSILQSGCKQAEMTIQMVNSMLEVYRESVHPELYQQFQNIRQQYANIQLQMQENIPMVPTRPNDSNSNRIRRPENDDEKDQQ